LILENIASLEELEKVWNLDDVNRANALLDMRQDLLELERKKVKK
jgi:ABC-type uncharacterized transport system substrate-binding protein